MTLDEFLAPPQTTGPGFWGTPLPSSDGKSVSIPDLTLAIASRNALGLKDQRLPDFGANLFKKPRSICGPFKNSIACCTVVWVAALFQLTTKLQFTVMVSKALTPRRVITAAVGSRSLLRRAGRGQAPSSAHRSV